MFIGGVPAELGDPETISDCGFICPRTFVGKAGYYWSDDKLAAEASDDYSLIHRRCVADKAYRIAYTTLVNEIAEEISVTDDGLFLGVSSKLAELIEVKESELEKL